MEKQKECPVCHTIFITDNNSKKYCSAACRETMKQVPKAATCATCGREFLTAGQGKYCSAECKKEGRKGKRKRKNMSWIDDITVAARAEGLSYGQYVAKYGL